MMVRCAPFATTLILKLTALVPLAVAQSLDTLPARVEGRRIHMVAAGSGSPTIILEAGYGASSRTWTSLQRELATSHRVVAYDRAGLGASELSPRPRSSRTIAEELRHALRSVGVEPPFVLIAHSAGGLHARVFAGLYPQEVVGLILVDPVPEGFYSRAKQEQPQVWAHFDSLDRAASANASPGERAEDASYELALQEARESDARYSGPVVVLSSPRADLRETGAIWTDEHRRWVATGRRREYVLLEGAGHNIHQERPDAVRAALRRVLAVP